MLSLIRFVSQTRPRVLFLFLFLPIAANASVYIPVPASAFGGGGGNVFASPGEGFIIGQTDTCTTPATGPDSCTVHTSNQFGDARGTGTGYIDAQGFHAAASVSVTGNAQATANGGAGIFDTRTNTSNQVLQFSMVLSIHATLASDPGSYAKYELDYYGVGQYVQYKGIQPTSWTQIVNGTGQIIEYDQTITTPVQVIQPGQTVSEELQFMATAAAFSDASACGSCSGLGAYVDALNTIQYQSFSITDIGGNPVDPSFLMSAEGFTNTPVSSASAPEPSTLYLSLAGGAIAVIRSRRLAKVRLGE